ncbi:MAG: ABC transporter ATP-binding protein [Alphaproteobacteria bacterium]|nr:ABC transporter ATP-binding protein [Alphaproteobacteria bacterium]
MSSLSVRNVTAGYGNVQVLHDVSINVGDGETVVLLGTNGNGKSTLIKSIVGLVKPEHGAIRVEIDGMTHDLGGKQPAEIVDLGIAIVPEGRQLFPKLTVDENLMMGAYRPKARSEIGKNLALCFETFPVLAQRRRQLAGSMSGGEQQMLALARALMASPKLLLIDEPSVGLAPIMVNRVIETIRQFKEKHRLTILMAEQNFTQAVKIADRGYVIVHGQIAHAGTAAELNDSDLIRRFYLGM